MTNIDDSFEVTIGVSFDQTRYPDALSALVAFSRQRADTPTGVERSGDGASVRTVAQASTDAEALSTALTAATGDLAAAGVPYKGVQLTIGDVKRSTHPVRR